jgi:RecA-family ATPase
MTALPVRPAHQLDVIAPEHRWLIEGLWGAEAVGIVGGEPKSCKSFLALDMAVSVASATPCLRRFPVARAGRVLLFAAEDSHAVVRQRLDGICATVGLRLADLDLQVITAPTLRLDIENDRDRLDQTVASLRPTLLVLDPFVRLHRVDENVSSESLLCSTRCARCNVGIKPRSCSCITEVDPMVRTTDGGG